MDREGLYGGRGDGRLVGQAGFARPPQPQQRQMECFSDEANSRDGEEEEANNGGGPQAAATAGGGGGDGASVETGKRRRGRPPGSKNKPKPPPVVTGDVEPAAAMRPHVLEVPAGGDVSRALAGFARRRGLGICVLAGTGAVVDVPLRHPSPPPPGAAPDGAAVIFRGRYEILSISATFLAPSMSAAVPGAVRDLSVSLAGPHGQIVGGAVAGPLVAATTVVVLAAAFTDLTFHRLPLEDDASASASGSAVAADEHRGHHQPQDASGLRPHLHSVAPATHQPVPLYGRQSQEVWPPAASAQRARLPYR
ncbi:AT-hook motif nuclear-localized protein 17-like [Panicum miliaceum]|uniref:AT-hook motif nuclear-localized protein 17-like n=1 Tax=Panicum miliaceum TaxID=4540 RepID=A0A3L6REX0_PANMI|nr:AT-hook motif nuclear-localized protein 17-like [Panicum miliaceum]